MTLRCCVVAAVLFGASADARAEPCYAAGFARCVAAAKDASRATVRAECYDDLDADACVKLGIMQVNGVDGVVDLAGAEVALSTACERDSRACTAIANAFRDGDGVPKDEDLAAYLSTFKLMRQGVTWSAEPTGVGDDSEVRRHAEYLFDCKQGNAESCANAALMYDAGLGAERDADQALRHFERACQLDRGLCVDIAFSYESGALLRKDARMAEELRDIALGVGLEDEGMCGGGGASRCVTYAHAYVQGEAVRQDLDYASVLMEKACESGDGQGCLGLANHLWYGPLEARDRSHAIRLYEQACNADSGAACWKLGRALMRGDGVEQDPARAETKIRHACTLDYTAACAYEERKP